MKKTDRFGEMLQGACRFGVIGGLASAIHLAAASGALAVGVHVMLANTVGFCTAVVVSVVGHHAFSFPGRTAFWRGARRFVPAAVVGFLVNNVVLSALIGATGSSHAWAKIAVAILVIPPATFGYAYFFAYRD